MTTISFLDCAAESAENVQAVFHPVFPQPDWWRWLGVVSCVELSSSNLALYYLYFCFTDKIEKFTELVYILLAVNSGVRIRPQIFQWEKEAPQELGGGRCFYRVAIECWLNSYEGSHMFLCAYDLFVFFQCPGKIPLKNYFPVGRLNWRGKGLIASMPWPRLRARYEADQEEFGSWVVSLVFL